MADRRVSVNVDADVSAFVRGMLTASAASKAFGTALKSNEPLLVSQQKQIDRFSGRVALLGEAVATIGPAFIPLGAAAVPALAGLTAGLGAAAGAAGVAVLAFGGVGDALKALDKYRIDPSAKNLEKLREEFDKLGPAGSHFAQYLAQIAPELKSLQNTAREGLLPGVEEGIEALLTKAPQVERIIAKISTEMGSLTARAGKGLAGDGFSDFFDYLETDAAPTLRDFAESIGNLVEGVGHLVVAFAPLSRDFSAGLVDMTQKFADWAAGLSQTQGFRDFVEYVRESTPQAMEFLGALANALVGIITAAAPFGQAVLPLLTDLANILAALADSPVGPTLFTAAAGFIALNRAVSVFGPSLAKLNEAFLDLRTSPNAAATAAERFGGAIRGISAAAGMGLFVSSLGEANQGLKTFEGVAGGALAGFAVGGPWGAAIGGAIGAVTSFGDANQTSAKYVAALTASLDEQTGALTENSRSIAAKALEDAGALEQAQQLGINLELVTSAALGNKDALAQVADELERYSNVDTPAGVDQELLKQRLTGEDLMKTLRGLSSDTDSTVAAQKRMGDAAKSTGADLREQAADLRAARSAARTTAQSFIGLGDSLNDSKVSLKDWIRQLQEQADALNNFTNNALRAARRGLDQGLIASLKEAGPEGAMRMKQLANATDAEIRRANAAWQRGEAAINRYARLTVPPKKITVNTSPAMAEISRLMAALNNIPDENVNIWVVRRAAGLAKQADVVDAHGGADGMTVPGPRYPYGDKVLAYLAPGEEVVTNRHGEADHLRATGRLPGYAAGGTIPGTGIGSATWMGPGRRGGIGPNSQLYGIDKAFLSIHELADRLDSLSAKQIRRLTRDIDDLSLKGMRKFKSALELASETTKRRRDELVSQRNDLRSSASQSFMHDALGGSLADFDLQIAADTNDARAMAAALKRAKAKGLDGNLAKAISTSGNLTLAQQFAGLTRAQIAAREKAFAGRAVAGNQIGAVAVAMTDLPKRIESLEATNKALTKTLHVLVPQLEAAVRRGAHDGTAQREKDKNRATANRARTR